VRTNPDPDDGITVAFTHGTILFVNAHCPNIFVAAQFLEAQAGMIGMVGKDPLDSARRGAYARIQCFVGTPETGTG